MTRLFLVESSETPELASSPDEAGGAVSMADLGPEVEEGLRPAPAADRGGDRDGRLRGLVDGYVDFVARVLRNAGTPQADVDDDVQRTFIIAARRLDDVRPGSWERGAGR